MTDQERLDYIDQLERLVAFLRAGRGQLPDQFDENDSEEEDARGDE